MISFIQLPLPLFGPEGLKTFRLNHPVYQEGKRYTHKIRWFLAEMSVQGIHREEAAVLIGQAFRDTEPIKYSRTRLRGQAQLIIFVQPGAYNSIVPGPDKIAAIIQPSHIPKLSQMVVDALKEYESR